MELDEELMAALERYATVKLNDFHRAQDVVQDVNLKLHNETKKIENLRAWCYRVARNICIDILRKPRQLPLEHLEGQEMLGDKAADPAKTAEAKESKMILRESLAKLPKKQQEAVRLKFQENLSYNEISEVMDETVASVGWLLHSALTTLRNNKKLQTSESK